MKTTPNDSDMLLAVSPSGDPAVRSVGFLKLRAIWYTVVWIKQWLAFVLHYLRVWELGASRPGMPRDEVEALYERMRTGPMRFEYARVEALKERAIAAWVGKAPENSQGPQQGEAPRPDGRGASNT